MENPRIYSTTNKLQQHIVLSIIEEFHENLRNMCGKCMDIGCGPGDVTKKILLPALGSNAQMIGTDISENMIKYANETFSDKKRIQFEVLDIETKNLPKKYVSEFDHIFSFHALHWCYDIKQAFKNMYQMLRPKGIILLNLVRFNSSMFEVFKVLARDIRFEPYTPTTKNNISCKESNYNRNELKEYLESIGFTIHHCSFRENNYLEENSELFLNSIISILSLNDMPQDLLEEFKNAMKCEYIKKYNYKSIHNNKEITMHIAHTILVYAQKI